MNIDGQMFFISSTSLYSSPSFIYVTLFMLYLHKDSYFPGQGSCWLTVIEKYYDITIYIQ